MPDENAPVPMHVWEDGSENGYYNWDELQPKLQSMGEGRTFAFEITRTRDDNLSFSQEAVDSLARGFMSFFLSRCHHEWETTGKMARKARVIVTVDLLDD